MITDFIKKKMQKAKYKSLDDGTYFGSITGLKGVWASARTREHCQKELQETLEDWIILKLQAGEKISGIARPSAHLYA